MDRSRHGKACHGNVGVGGRLKQRLARLLLQSPCATTSATAFVSVAKTSSSPATRSRREPPPTAGPCCHEPRPKIVGSCWRGRRRSARALVHISIDCSGVGAGATASARRSAGAVGPVLLRSSTPVKDVRSVKSKSRNGSANGRKLRSPSYSCSSSFTFTDDELAPFSSDGERGEEAATRSTLFSSLSFSSDSTSDFYATSTRPKHHKKPPRRAPRRAPPRGAESTDTFRRAVPVQVSKHDKGAKKSNKEGGGGVGAAGGMAVVKRSHNPYEDFRSSMVEMVVERRIFGADAMGELLVSYLTLNSRRHHPAILAAFEAVWEAVFFGNEP